MKATSSFLLAACVMASAPIFAQTAPEPAAPLPPPAPATIAPAPLMPPVGRPAAQGQSSNRASRVEGIDYAPDGSIRIVYLRDGAFVHLSPELSRQAGEFLHKGVKLAATGEARTFAHQTTFEANSITVAGRTFIAPGSPTGPQLAAGTPPPPPPDAARVNGEPIVRPGAPRPGSPVPPPAPAMNVTPQPVAAPLPRPAPDATTTPQP